MRIFNSHSTEKCKRGLLGFFNIHSVAKHQKNRRGDPLKTLKNFEKSLTKPKRGRGKSHSAEKLEGGPFWVLHFKVEAFGCVQNQVLVKVNNSQNVVHTR